MGPEMGKGPDVGNGGSFRAARATTPDGLVGNLQ